MKNIGTSVSMAIAIFASAAASAAAVPGAINMGELVDTTGKTDVSAAIHRANNIRTPGSCYSMTGGIVDGSAGFEDRGFHNSYDRCYSDHFSTGFFFGKQGGFAVLRACVSYWYAPCKGKRHTAIGCERTFTANVSDMHIGFRGAAAVNTVLEVHQDGGCGYIRDIRMDERLVNEKEKQYLKYMR